jgi:poly-beta-1,6-N-acetyl-D-glucosamine synthase
MDFTEAYGLALVVFCVPYAAIILAFTYGLFYPVKSRDPEARGRADPEILSSPVLVSVILPVRNEAGNILRILGEMQGQDYPGHLTEVIVSDDQSGDATMDLARSFAGRYPEFQLVLVPSAISGNDPGGKKRAIQRAVEVAGGEIILCTDADTTRGPHWISSMAACFGDTQLRMSLGPVVFDPAGNLLQKIQSLEFMGIMGTTAGSANLGWPVMCNGANIAYRRSAFTGTGGFEGNLEYRSGDDQFLMGSIRKQYGKRAVMFNRDPASIVTTGPESSLEGFIHQRIRWVSKSRGYRDPVIIATGLATWLVHLLLLAGFLAGIFNPSILMLTLALWLGKITLEFLMVWFMRRFSGKKGFSGYYLLAQAFQLVYVPIIGILGLFIPFRWKGRKASR